MQRGTMDHFSGDSVDILGPTPESLLDAAAALSPAADPHFDAQAAIQAAQAAHAAAEQDVGSVAAPEEHETGWEALQNGLSGVDVDAVVEPVAPVPHQLTRGQDDLYDSSLNVVRRQLTAAIGSLAGLEQPDRYGPLFEDGLRALNDGLVAQVEAADAIRARASEMMPVEDRDPSANATSPYIDPALRGERESGLPVYSPFLVNRERRGVKRAREPARKKQESNPDETRKQRMLRLEHLVHKYANRRLGVEYSVKPFNIEGSTELPDPRQPPPPPDQTIHGVQEYRPDFSQIETQTSVTPFFAAVRDDVKQAWDEGEGRDDMDAESVDEAKIVEAIKVYWIRLTRRWDRQQATKEGQVHKDELIHRKQNQFRRQQSLLARRVAAFDQSPLNYCRLRALYRTLLTADFAAPTNERPDPQRNYTEEEWYAAREAQGGGNAHEVVDIFWLSNSARTLLELLDLSVTEQANQLKGKGKPRQPAPTFRLPRTQWAEGPAYLPKLRPRGPDGLPVDEPGGIVLFRWHVDEAVQRAYPEWAQGLYDDPPVPPADAPLPDLQRVMSTREFAGLLAALSRSHSQQSFIDPSHPPQTSEPRVDIPDPSTLPSIYDVAPSARTLVAEDGSAGRMEADDVSADGKRRTPRPGTSLRARKQSKRSTREAPEGAATPVAKRPRVGVPADGLPLGGDDPAFADVEGDLEQDRSFLTSL